MSPDLWTLWQLADSAFPSGGFAHSAGLEAAAKLGHATTVTELEPFCHASLHQAAHGVLPFFTAGYRHPQRLLLIDRACDAFLSNHVANRASRAQGQALVVAAHAAFDTHFVAGLRDSIHRNQLAGHWAPAFGSIAQALQVDFAHASALLLFTTLRDVISAAVRLNIVGPLQGQALQHHLTPQLHNWAQVVDDHRLPTRAQTAPVLEILHMRQDQLYSRLFHS